MFNMEKKLLFRLPSPTAWRSIASAAIFALLAYWLSAGGFGFGSFLFLAIVLYVLAFQFSEWRRVKYSLLALALALGALFTEELASLPTLAGACVAGALSVLLFMSSTSSRDPRRTFQRVFGVALTFIASTLFFAYPTPFSFFVFAVVVALLTRDEALSWAALRVGEGKLIGAAVGFFGAEIATFVGLLPLGPVRAGAFTALVLLIAREGLGEAYQGGLRRNLMFHGLAVFFALSVLIFASAPWTV
ncbi:MAG: hypothetical protein V1885_01175 [Candidatus Brennerbacteria bacterium]